MSEEKIIHHWSNAETMALISIWREQKIINMFSTCKRHSEIFKIISDEILMLGYNRTGKEVKNKINNLKQVYHKVKPKSGGAKPDWPYFDDVNYILGNRDKYNVGLGDESFHVEFLDENSE